MVLTSSCTLGLELDRALVTDGDVTTDSDVPAGDACTACTESCGGQQVKESCFNTDQCAEGLVCFAGLCWPPCCDGPGSCGNSLQKCYQDINASGDVVASACVSTPPCSPLNPDDCLDPLGCYFVTPDDTQDPLLLCAPSSQNLKEGQPCNGSNACEPGLFCYQPEGAPGYTCHRICDHTETDQNNVCTADQACPETVRFESGGRNVEFGVCVSSTNSP